MFLQMFLQRSKLKLQSDDTTVLTTLKVAPEHEEHKEEYAANYTKVSDITSRTDLNQYLNRPVLIKTVNWTEAASVSETFYPWYLYFNHPSIKKRIDNYAFMKCNLNIRVLITASPFYYGAVLVSYKPYSDEAVCPISTVSANQLISRSQRPSFNVYPQDTMGGEMKLPFLFHKEYMDITSQTDINMMGALNMTSFDVLRNANSVTGDSATIQVFAWADNVELSGPTIALALQSRDEYHEGVVSKPASAISHYAGKLSGWPIIGNFATATSIAAGAVASIASLFGYTNVPNIKEQAAFKPTSNPLLATTDISVAIEKLTLDCKNELTIDNSTYSAGPPDPLSIQSLCSRESYLTAFLWSATDTPSTLLFNSLVTPCLYRNYAYTFGIPPVAGNEILNTPMSMVANLFQYWRGDIKFRFVFICSQYHRGKVRILWDPKAQIGSTPSAFTEIFSKVIDISEQTDVSITIPYNQAAAFLPTLNVPRTQSTMYGTSAVTPTVDNNGIMAVSVLNRQTSPVASAPIQVLVYVSAPDIDFESPDEVSIDYNAYPLQSKDCDLSKPCEDNLFETAKADEHLNLLYMGEKIVSLRQLMRRASHSITLACTDFYQAYTQIGSTMNRMPLYPGFDPNGIGAAATFGSPGVDAPYNFCSYTPLNWVTQCFVGYRGSVIWHFNVNGSNEATNILVRRSKNVLDANAYINASTIIPSSESQTQRIGKLRTNLTPMGSTLVNSKVQTGVAFLAPWYSQFKFAATTALQRTLGRSVFGTTTDSVSTTIVVEASATKPAVYSSIDMYVGIGTDYDPVFFLNVPVVYYKAGLPVAQP